MRNDSKKWAASIDPFSLNTDNLKVSSIAVSRLTVISGDRLKALDFSGFTRATGWPEGVLADSYALSIRRDRILIVNGPDIPDGWHEQMGLAISDATEALVCFELTGAEALPLLNALAEIDPQAPSASCMRMLQGVPVILYRVAEHESYRVLVAPAETAAFFTHLSAAIAD